MDSMKIGELASQTGLSTKAIRYYEEIGILPPAERSSNGYRHYQAEAADRIGFIKDAQAAGLSLIEIQTILELREEGEATCEHTIGMLEGHLDSLTNQLEELERTRIRLTALIHKAKALDPAHCNDPNRCQTIAAQN